ncbi:hypothetical protein GCM10010307_45330 [Streptomyces vastus]|uniref:Uncharacterized protein n=1 Tax=Streptomyces vastus TaxID=285451 RepID=A0ABN3R3G3_9ACTN
MFSAAGTRGLVGGVSFPKPAPSRNWGLRPQAPAQGWVVTRRVAAVSSSWLVAQFPAPLKNQSLRLAAPGESTRPGQTRTPNFPQLPTGPRPRTHHEPRGAGTARATTTHRQSPMNRTRHPP